MVIGWVEYNSGSNWASNFTSSADLKLWAQLLPELYDTKSSYQLILSLTKCNIKKSTYLSGIYS